MFIRVDLPHDNFTGRLEEWKDGSWRPEDSSWLHRGEHAHNFVDEVIALSLNPPVNQLGKALRMILDCSGAVDG